jgi:protein kinase X
VRLARHKASGAPVALKALSKAHLVHHGQVAHLRSERDVLLALDGPAYVRLLGVFQDAECVYFALEYVPGGEFFRHLRTRGRLPEAAARFYAAEVAAALAALHARGIVYRDLKPENLLLDAGGHIKVADFGFAKALPRGGRTYTLCGTPDYLAPEVILNKGHGAAADWWAFGVLVYEMLAGAPPFVEADVGATYRRAVEGRFSTPPHFSAAARDLVRRLLQVDLSQRLGCLAGGVGDIKGHAWFRGVDWAAVAAQAPGAGAAPIRPPVRHAADTANFDDYSGLAPQEHVFVLSRAEQALFADF